MPISTLYKDVILRATFTFRNPTKVQALYLTNLLSISKDNLLEHKIDLDKLYISEKLLDNIHALRTISTHDLCDETIKIIKKRPF